MKIISTRTLIALLAVLTSYSSVVLASIPRASLTKAELDKKLLSQYFQPLHDSDLPSDIGPVSLEVARKVFVDQAAVYQSDLAKAQAQRFVSCTASWLEGSEVARAEAAPFTLNLLQKIPRWLGPPQVIYSSAIPLKAPLAGLAASGKLTPAELQALDRLRTTEVEDVADRAQLSIDTKSFLMRVTARLYDSTIELHQERGQDALPATLEQNQELCTISNLRAEKDSQLIESAKHAVAFYDALTVEMHQAHLF